MLVPCGECIFACLYILLIVLHYEVISWTFLCFQFKVAGGLLKEEHHMALAVIKIGRIDCMCA